MEADCTRAKASFMNRASDLRGQLHFAEPKEKMQAINLYCSDGYGTMLRDLASDASEKFFTAWNIQARTAFDIPRENHCYLVHDYFCKELIRLKRSMLGR